MANKQLLITLGLDSTSYTKNVKKAKDNLKELDSQFDVLSSSTEKYEKSLSGLESKQENLNNKIKMATGLSELHSQRIEESTKALNKSQQEVADFSKKLGELKKELETLEKTGKGTKTFEQLQKEIKGTQQQLDKATKSVETHSKRLTKANTDYNQTQVSIQKMTKELTLAGIEMEEIGKNKSFDKLAASTKKLEDEFEIARKSIDNFDNSFEGLGKSLEFYNKKGDNLKKMMSILDKEIKSTNKTILDQEKEVKRLTTQLANWEKKLAGLQPSDAKFESTKRKVEELRQELTRATTTLESNQNKVKAMTSTYSSLEKEYAKISRAAKDTKAKMEELNKNLKLTGVKDEVKSLTNGELTKLSDKLKSLNNDFKATETKMGSLEKSFAGLAVKQKHYNEAIKLTKQYHDGYGQEIEQTKNKINALEKEEARLIKQLEKRKALVDTLQGKKADDNSKKIKEINDALIKNNAELERHKNYLNTCNKEYEASGNQIKVLSAQLDRTNKQFVEMRQSVSFKTITTDIKALTNDAMTSLDNKIKANKTSLQTLETETKGYENTITGVNTKVKILADSFELVKKKNSMLAQEYAKSVKSVENLSKKQQELNKQIKEYEKAFNAKKKPSAEMDELAKKAEAAEKELKDVTKQLEDQMKRSKDLGKNFAASKNDVRLFEAELKKALSQMKNLGKADAIKKLDNEIKSLSNATKILDSAFERTKSKVDNFGRSIKDRNTELEYHKQKIKLLKESYTTLSRAYDANKTSADQLRAKNDSLKKSMEEIRKKLSNMGQANPKFQELTNQLIRLETEFRENKVSITAFDERMSQLRVEMNQTATATNNLRRSQENLNTAYFQNSVARFSTGLTNAGSTIRGIGQSMMGLSATTNLLGGAMIKTGVSFERAMSNVRAVMSPTQSEFNKLEETARQLGKTTIFTSTQVAEGMKYLGLAGYNTNQALETIPKTLMLAQAGALELGLATDLATDSLSALGYVGDEQVSKMSDYLDMVAKAAARSNLDVEQMMRTYIKVGGQVDNMKISIEEASAMIGIMANRGLKAEIAGTSLNSVLINLTKAGGESAKAMEKLGVSAFDSEGKIKGIEQIMQELAVALHKFPDKTEIQLTNMLGGKTQVKALLALLKGMTTETGELTDEYKNLKKEISEAPSQNFLEEQSKIMGDNVWGDLKRLGSAIQGFFEDVFKSIQPELRTMLQGLTENVGKLADKFLSLSPQAQMALIKFGAFLMVGPPLMMIFGGMVSGLGRIGNALLGTGGSLLKFGKKIKDGQRTISVFSRALSIKSQRLLASGRAASTAGGLTGKFGGAVSTAGGKVGGLVAKIGGFIGGLSGATLATVGAIGALVGIATVIGNNTDALGWLIDEWGVFGIAIAGVCEFIAGVVKLVFGNIGIFIKGLGSIIKAFVSGDWKSIPTIWSDTMAEVKTNTSQAMSDIKAETTRGLLALKEATQNELDGVKKTYQYFSESLKKITHDDIPAFANTYSELFEKIDQNTLQMLKGTSDTMALLFDGIKENMEKSQMKEIFQKNLEEMVQSGKLKSETLERDFKKAFDTISKHSSTGVKHLKKETDAIVAEIEEIPRRGLYPVSQNIAFAIEEMSSDTFNSLKNMGGAWERLLTGIDKTSGMTTEEMSRKVIENVNKMKEEGIDIVKLLKDGATDELKKMEAAAAEGSEGVKEAVVQGMEGTREKAQEILSALGTTTEVGISGAAGKVVEILQGMDSATITTLMGMSDEWYGILYGATTEGGELTSDFAQTVVGNLNHLGINTPEKMQAFIEKLKLGMDGATLVVQEGSNNMEQVTNGTGEVVADNLDPKDAEKKITDSVNKGAAAASQGKENIDQATKGTAEKVEENVVPKTLEQKTREEMQNANAAVAQEAATLKTNTEKAGADAKTGFQEKIKGINETINIDGTLINLEQLSAQMDGAGQAAMTAFATGFGKHTGLLSEAIKTQIPDISMTMSAPIEGVSRAFENLAIKAATAFDNASKLKGAVESVANANLNGAVNNVLKLENALKSAKTHSGNLKGSLSELSNIGFGVPTNSANGLTNNLKAVKSAAEGAIKANKNLASVNLDPFTKKADNSKKKIDEIKKASEAAKKSLDKIINSDFNNLIKSGEAVRTKLLSIASTSTSTASKLSQLNNVSFGGLISKLNSVISMLNNVISKARNVSVNVSSIPTKRSIGADMPNYDNTLNTLMRDSFIAPQFDIFEYKTSGGFFDSNSLAGTGKQAIEQNNNSEMLAELRTQNRLLMQLLTADKDVNMVLKVDGRTIAKSSAKYMKKEIETLESKSNRLRGGR